MTKTAFITGITGQDGAYLAKYLQAIGGYNIVGLARRSSSLNLSRLEKLRVDINSIQIEYFDLIEPFNIQRLLSKYQPTEIYNLAAQTFVSTSLDVPLYTMEVNSTGVYRFVETIMNTDMNIKFYQACTSEMFGQAETSPQCEQTILHPRSPYGVAKVAAYWYVKSARENRGFFGCNGITYNHESPLRGTEFVTKKITSGLANIKFNNGNSIKLGDINAKRDWGHASDFVRAMHSMLQYNTADDYVISSEECHSIKEFCEIAAAYLDYELIWSGNGINAKGIDYSTGKVLIEIDPKFFRPADGKTLIGDSTKARKILNWHREFTFKDLVTDMIKSDAEKFCGN